MKTNSSANPSPGSSPVPVPGNRAQVLLRSLKRALEQFQGRAISYKELGDYAQQAAGTVFDKLQKAKHPQIEAVLGWLERLPVDTRIRLLNGGCRDFPCLVHSRLRHDPAQITALNALLRQPTGFTLVTGETTGLRSWLMAALGHGSLMLEPDHRIVTGVDRHVADWFAPVPGVRYLGASPIKPPGVHALQTNWSKCKSTNAGVAFFNDVVSLQPGLRLEALGMAKHRNVFVADGEPALVSWFSRHASPAVHPRRLTVRLVENERIQEGIEPLSSRGRR